jgi:hypothetical protein
MIIRRPPFSVVYDEYIACDVLIANPFYATLPQAAHGKGALHAPRVPITAELRLKVQGR